MEIAGTKEKKRYKHSEKKAQEMMNIRRLLLETGRSEFEAKGFGKTTVSEITNKAGVAKGTFFLYFRSKESLYIEIAWLILEELTQELNRETTACHTGIEMVRSIGRTVFNFYRKNRFYYDVISYVNKNTKSILKSDGRFQSSPSGELLHKAMDMGMRDGSISGSVNPTLFMAFASSTIWGMLLYLHERSDVVSRKVGSSEKDLVDYSLRSIELALK
jgi:AcrR family transcriptional regulator